MRREAGFSGLGGALGLACAAVAFWLSGAQPVTAGTTGSQTQAGARPAPQPNYPQRRERPGADMRTGDRPATRTAPGAHDGWSHRDARRPLGYHGHGGAGRVDAPARFGGPGGHDRDGRGDRGRGHDERPGFGHYDRTSPHRDHDRGYNGWARGFGPGYHGGAYPYRGYRIGGWAGPDYGHYAAPPVLVARSYRGWSVVAGNVIVTTGPVWPAYRGWAVVPRR
jgi:hypothetical protein